MIPQVTLGTRPWSGVNSWGQGPENRLEGPGLTCSHGNCFRADRRRKMWVNPNCLQSLFLSKFRRPARLLVGPALGPIRGGRSGKQTQRVPSLGLQWTTASARAHEIIVDRCIYTGGPHESTTLEARERGGGGRDALEGKGPARRPQKQLDRRVEAKRLGAVTVGYNCNGGWHLASGGQWGTSPPFQCIPGGGGGGG